MHKHKIGLLARLEAKPGKAMEVEHFLKSGLSIVQEEVGTMSWFAVRISKSTFGIFDTFENEHARQAHLEGCLAAALMSKASELLSQDPIIEKFDILVEK